MDGIKGLPKINECYYCWKLVCFDAFYKPALGQNVPNRKSILVSPEVTIQYRSKPIEDLSSTGQNLLRINLL